LCNRQQLNCPLKPGQEVKVDVAEVVEKKYPWDWIIAGAVLLAGTGIYFRKDIATFFKNAF